MEKKTFRDLRKGDYVYVIKCFHAYHFDVFPLKRNMIDKVKVYSDYNKTTNSVKLLVRGFVKTVKPMNKKKGVITLGTTPSLTYGTDGELTYTYDGDGEISCTSSDTSAVTCSVNATNHKVILHPVKAITSNVTITVASEATSNYKAGQAVYVVTSENGLMSVTANGYSGTWQKCVCIPQMKAEACLQMNEENTVR